MAGLPPPAPRNDRRSRRWCWTLHIPPTLIGRDEAESIRLFTNWFKDECLEFVGTDGSIVDYVGAQIERTAANGLHLQGVLHCVRPTSLSQLKEWGGWYADNERFSPHFEIMRGSWSRAKAYCEKADSRVYPYQDAGEEPSQGTRTDLADLYQRLRDGESKLEVADAFPGQFMRYHRAFDAVVYLREQERAMDRRTHGIFIYGPPGVGKSRFARDLVTPVAHFFYAGQGQWFDGYYQQPAAVFDDISSDQLPVRILLRLLDFGPFRVNVKGRMPDWNSKVAIFTSNNPPEVTFRDASVPDAAVLRRFDVVIYIDDNGVKHYKQGSQGLLYDLMLLCQ